MAACILEGADPAEAGVDPGRNLFGDRIGAPVTFRQIHEPGGKPIKYEKVVPGIGAVDHDEIVKGFELSKGNYVLSLPCPLRRQGHRMVRF